MRSGCGQSEPDFKPVRGPCIIEIMRTAIFLDRDGVIVENRAEYVRAWSDVAFIPGALDALARLNKTPYAVVLVTNQSAVGRGLISQEKALDIQRDIEAAIFAAGGRIDDTLMCTHAPWEDCPCRKPRPGLLLLAAEKHALDLERSFMIGDALSDVQAGRSAGVFKSALVLTGRGSDQIHLAEAEELAPIEVFPRLSDFIDYLLSTSCDE
jgi:D-glycero-D-manno-heptose 1,7-bisphosphate phosphatase